jgi:uncharacterized membrane protein
LPARGREAGRRRELRRVAAVTPDDVAASSSRRELDRVGAFSDGVFAIAITLLVLNLEVPSVPGSELGDALRTLWDNLIAYVIGFAVMGRFWYGHHKLFARLDRSDPRLVTTNLGLLATIGLMPFTTALIGNYTEPLAIAAYALNVALAAVLSGLLEVVAASDGLLEDGRGAMIHAREAMVGGLATAGLFIASIAVAYAISPRAALWSWLLLIPLGRFLGRRSAGATLPK